MAYNGTRTVRQGQESTCERAKELVQTCHTVMGYALVGGIDLALAQFAGSRILLPLQAGTTLQFWCALAVGYTNSAVLYWALCDVK